MPTERPEDLPDNREDGESQERPGLDVDAMFAAIVARWEPSAPQPEPEPVPEAGPEPETAPDPGTAGRDDALQRLFQPAWSDPLDTEATWEEEGHFVPPPPPPLPPVEPRRRVAWAALAGSPVLALLLTLAGVAVPQWGMFFLVVAFVGGFGYLVATMSSSPPDDWSGDDGARI